ncbi:hypothetical protein PFISCL1PPCAC_13184, partial [Pristionchus fissidentatus]
VFSVVESAVSLACLVLVLVTLPIYMTTVACLIRDYNIPGPTSNSFYRICMVGGIVDILAIVVNYLLSILPARGYLLPFYLSTPKIGTTYLALAWGTRYSQNITAIIMGVNRLTAILYPFKFRTMWSDSMCYLMHAVQIVPGMIGGGALYLSHFYYQESGLGGYYV